MALERKNKLAPANAVAPEVTDIQAETVAVETQMETGKTKKSSNKDSAKAKFYSDLKESGRALRAQEKEAGIDQIEGSLQDKVAFITSLGNPTKVGTRTEKGETDIPVIETVGYRLKAMADIKVPHIVRGNLPKNDIMGFKEVEWREVKAGEEFLLTRGELGQMITLPEYNGMFTGDPDNMVELQVTVAKAAGNTFRPLAVLKKTIIPGKDTTPIKAQITPVAVRKEGAKEDSNSVKDFEVLPEYQEKFGYLFEESLSVGRAGGKTKPNRQTGESAAELAAALRAFNLSQARQDA